MSGWYDRHGYINMLKVLYRDLVTDPDKLCAATKVMDLFELLHTSGHLSGTNLTILIDTINVTKPFGLEPEIRRLTMTTLLPARTVIISKFTRNRQILIEVVNNLNDGDVKEISKQYNCSQKADRWELFAYLEQRNVFCEKNMDNFMRTITTSQIIDSQTDPQGLPFAERAASQRKSTIDDKVQLMVIKDTDATNEIGRAKSSDNLCTVENNIVIQGNPGFVTGSPFNQCNIGTVNVSTTVFPATQDNGVQHVASPSSRQSQEQLKVIKDQLTARQKKVYQDVNRMTPATWNKKYDIDINQVFTNLILLKSKRENKEKQSRGTTTDTSEPAPEPTTLTEVLSIMKSTDSCKTLITGKGGMGKTTLLRYIAYNWATDVDNTFDGKILFLINIRDIKESANFLDVIMRQIHYAKEIILENNLPNDSVERFLVIHANEIVILLDGYDELERNAKDPVNLFKGLELGKSTVLLTSRPENIDDLIKNCDVQFEVNGFSKINIREYIYKYFASINKIELGKSLNQELGLISTEHAYFAGGNRKVTLELCSSPLLLLKVCTIWGQKQHIPEDLSDLFKELFCCILNQYKNRSGNKIAVSQFNKIPKEYKCAILALGKCIYEGLQENLLTIDKYELTKILENDEDLVDLALKPGFVYRNNPVCPDDLNEIYTTPHKLLSEALAGFHVAEQTQIDRFIVDEYEMIRSNKYLHMTRVFAIGFLGDDAGKLLKHWLIIGPSNYYSLAQYFRYIKKEHQEHVLQILDEHMSIEMKNQSEQMYDSFENVLPWLCDESVTVSKGVHLISLMSRCCVKYEEQPEKLEQCMLSNIEKSTEISHICSVLVHILFILQGLVRDHCRGCINMFNYLNSWKETEIDILSATMGKLKFQYTWIAFEVSTEMNPKLLILLLKNASYLASLSFYYNSVTGVVLNQVLTDLLESQTSLKLSELDLSKNDLYDGVSFVNLVKTAPQLKVLKMSDCKLTGTILNEMVIECQSYQVVLNLKHLDISRNNFRGSNEAILVNLLKIVPKLEFLDISENYMTFRFRFNFGEVLQKLDLNGNDLSNINGVFLIKLMRLLDDDSFTWVNYSLTCVNLQDLVNSCGVDVRLTWNYLKLSGINLASVSGRTLARLIKISPQLSHLEMKNCNLSGNSIRDLLNECDNIGVVLKDNMLRLQVNDLSDIDGVSLAKLVRMIAEYKYEYPAKKKITWCKYCLSAVNLQDLVNACGVDGRMTWNNLDLSGINLASVNGKTLARLIEISPQLSHLNMRNCNLSGSSIRDVLNECDKIDVVLKDNMLKLKDNFIFYIDGVSLAKFVRMISKSEYYDNHPINEPFAWWNYCLSAVNLQDLVNSCGVDGRLPWNCLDLSGINLASVNGKTLARLIQISPQLCHLDMRNCNLSGSSIRDIIIECDKIGMVLNSNMLRVRFNNLSDIDGASLAKLVRIIDVCRHDYSNSPYNYLSLERRASPQYQQPFIWNDYCLSAVNLQDLVNSCGDDGRLPWSNLDLSGINLASVNGRTLARLIKISPQLSNLDLRNCNLSGSSIRDVLNECDKMGVVLKGTVLRLKGNDLSDIDGVLLAKLVRINPDCDYDYSNFPDKLLLMSILGGRAFMSKSFIWNDYCLSAVNLQDFVNSYGVEDGLTWNKLDLSGINLSSVNGKTLARLIKISPQLSDLDMRNCNLSGSSIRDVLNECDKMGVVLKDNMLRLKGNDLSDIDGVSLAKLVRINAAFDYDYSNTSNQCLRLQSQASLSEPFIWNDYCFSAINLQSFVNSCGVEGRLLWTNLNLRGIDLASVNGRTLARLIKISPQLSNLDMINCNLSGSTIRDALNECDKMGVVLKGIILRLKGNDLSDIDGVSLVKLVRMITGTVCRFKDRASLPEPFIWNDYCFSAVNLQDFVSSCGVDDRLIWTNLNLSGINLASVNGRTLARLINISPRLSHLDLRNCNLSGSSIRDVINECDKMGVVLKGKMLKIKGNDLSDIDGLSLAKLVRMNAAFGYSNTFNQRLRLQGRASLPEIFIWNDYCFSAVNLQSFVNSCGVECRLLWTNLDLSGINLALVNGRTIAYLIKISPQLSHLDMRNCNLSGSSIRDVVNECDKDDVVLKDNMLKLKDNDLSDINGVSLAKLVRIIVVCSYEYFMAGYRTFSHKSQTFIWNNYRFSAINLQDLVNSCGDDGRLPWSNLDLSGINLESVNGRTIARLIKISPHLSDLGMRNCNLSGSTIRDVLNECDKMGVVLKGTILRLKGNDLSDIDGVSLAKLVRMFTVCSNTSHICSRFIEDQAFLLEPFMWNDYCFSAVNLQDFVSSCGVDDILIWTNLNLSGINLASVNGKTLARLINISPQLSHLDLRNCNMSGSNIRDILNECDKMGVVLRGSMLRLQDNDLSAVNLQDLVNSCGDDGRLWSNLDLSRINLESVNGRTIARLIKISPHLSNLDMRNCNLSGSTIRDALNECDKMGVVLKGTILRLKGNDLSDIDGVSLVKLVRMFAVCRYDYYNSFHNRFRFFENRASLPEPFIWNDYCFSAVNLQDFVSSCGVDDRLIWTHLNLSGINLASVNGRTLARLINISPQLSHLGMRNCNLSGSSIRDILNECDKMGVVLRGSMLRLQDNDLSAVNLQGFVNSCGDDGRLQWSILDLSGINLASVNGRTIARLIKISPHLSNLGMRNCNLSGSSIRDVLNECDKMGVVLKGTILRLKGNDLSDIDGVSLAKLVRIIAVCRYDYSNFRYNQLSLVRASPQYQQPFIWNDYCLSAVNLQSLVNSCGENGRLPWSNLDLSGIILASVNGRTIARLIKISPQLSNLDMRNCNLSGSSIRDILIECDKMGVVLKGKILRLKGNDISDIDGVYLAKIVKLSVDVPFKWHEYFLSTANLQDLVSSLGKDNSNIEIDLSNINLSELNPSFFSTLGNIYNIIMIDCSLRKSMLHDSVQMLSDRNVKLALVKLDLGNNNLAELSGQSLTSLLCIFPNLRQLSMSRCHLRSIVLYDMVTKCKERNIVFRITDLDLSGNDFSSLNGATISALSRHIPFLKRLNMSDCSLSGSIMEDLSKISSDGKRMMALKNVNLSGNNFNVLCKTIAAPGFNGLIRFVPGLKTLDISKCSLSGSIVQHLCSENNKLMKLTSISLGGNDLSGLNWSSIASEFLFTFTRLKILKINDCHLTGSGLHNIANYFSKTGLGYILKLTEVDLSNNDLGNVDVPSLLPLIQAVPKMEVLNISNCNIKGKDVTDLIHVLLYVDSWSSLRHFYVHKNNFSDIDGSSLASISSFNHLLYLDVSSCHLNDDIFIDMVDSWKFESLHSLQINIRDNNVVNKFKVEKKLSAITCDLKTD
ncbi:uncharacterized protein LOC117103017 [Anneissia japonica]|uniref:uncharacterized protein LOC117103017 n=1 Tax=Anneissia japonica TaxID=1529436 RepID=UPI001425752A|nr:uncharacterized protein LOC117103017 [Anneissia japonica]